MDAKHFSFCELERRITAMPDGPISVLNRPRWQYWCDIIGGVGVIIGLLPSLFIQFVEPKPWMVVMAKIGIWTMMMFLVPGIFRGVWAIALVLWRGKSQDTAQLDFDFEEMGRLYTSLASVPRQTLEQHLRFIRVMQARVAAKLSLMGGGFDRFGLLPLILAIAVQLKTLTVDSLETPLWQIVPGLFFAIGYLIGLNATFMRVRMNFYEVVLAEALERRNE